MENIGDIIYKMSEKFADEIPTEKIEELSKVLKEKREDLENKNKNVKEECD